TRTTTRPATTTTIDMEDTALFRVDPATLQPLAGIEPIPAGDYFWGSVSNDRRWLVGRAEDEDGGLAEVRLIDVDAWEVVATWQPVGYGEPHVTDDGVIYYLQGGPGWPALKQLSRGISQDEVASELPEGFSPVAPIHQQGELIAVHGTTGDWDGSDQKLKLVTVDMSSGTVTEIDLPQVTIGAIEQVDIGEEWFPFVGAYPAVVWDGTRALVVHADRDVVTEVDLETGVFIDHPFGPETSESGGLLAWLVAPAQAGGMPSAETTRSAVLNPVDGLLYIATRVGQAIVETEDDWYLRTDSVGLKVVDTNTWTLVDRLDAPIGEVDISPDGTRLLARGFTSVDRLSSTNFESHGVFVIDTSNLEVLAHHQGGEDWYNPISFSADGRFGYVSTWAKTDIVDLEWGDILGEVPGSGMPLWGEVGVMALPNTR
ncbi:MAG TPA: hypothetical protein VIH55_06630, partial [Acidimicrobiia bacterium]